MAINWFPGHMHKAQKEIRALIPQVDLVIEVLDARIPYSSQNPLLQSIRGEKPSIKLLNKSYLSDPQMNDIWVNCLEQDDSVQAFLTEPDDTDHLRELPQLCEQMFANKVAAKKKVHVMIMGIPNVGKSTLINIISQRSIAETGNEPAVTKRQQRINLSEHVVLHDTPGVLWPKFENQNSGYRLAATGAIKDHVVELEDIAFYAVEYLMQHYPQLLQQRFELERLAETPEQVLEDMAARRGSLKGRGMVDYYKISKIFLTELRSGQIGRVTFETPDMMRQELQQVAEQRALEEQKKQQRKARGRKNKR